MRAVRSLLVLAILLHLSCASSYEPPVAPRGHPADPTAAPAPAPGPTPVLELPPSAVPEDPDELSRGSRIPDRGGAAGMHGMHEPAAEPAEPAAEPAESQPPPEPDPDGIAEEGGEP